MTEDAQHAKIRWFQHGWRDGAGGLDLDGRKADLGMEDDEALCYASWLEGWDAGRAAFKQVAAQRRKELRL